MSDWERLEAIEEAFGRGLDDVDEDLDEEGDERWTRDARRPEDWDGDLDEWWK